MGLTPRRAVDLLRRERILTLTPTGRARSLVEEIAGGPIRGSWWGHAKGKAIYACAVAIADSGEAVSVKLIGGKVTFVHRALWPALYRVATDATRVRRAIGELDAAARDLLARVERAGELRLDQPARARDALETRLLVLGDDLHTEKGHHVKVLRTWSRWGSDEVKREARRLTFEAARASLAVDD